jgi:hypothetical protein
MVGPWRTRHTLWGPWWGRLLWVWAAQPHCLASLGEWCPAVTGVVLLRLKSSMAQHGRGSLVGQAIVGVSCSATLPGIFG